ncbi:cell division control protein 45 homolog [Rhopilema esculentum]|uniref:cell division control protein 45 homolog n=1 Tax=Rhopilema esculentum TaxID=499914 RepID=UPI0031CF8985
MFVERPKEEVYDIISTERVLILVSLDVDALCACKILLWLFQRDHVQYTVIPIEDVTGLKTVYEQHKDQVKHYFLVNCGATFNVSDGLDPDEEAIFYIVDSHRPFDLDNVYNQSQVKILIKDGDTFDEIPDFEKVYDSQDVHSSEQEDDDDLDQNTKDLEPSSKRQRTNEGSYLSKNARKRKWEQEREKILFQYYEYTFYGTSSAVVMHELAWKMSKDNNDLVWWATIGLTEQYVHEKVLRETYVSNAASLHEHILRLNVNEQDSSSSISSLRLSYEDDLGITLYRHWSLFDSICNTRYTACKFRIWTMKGQKKLHDFLASLGLPIIQCKQNFSSMDVQLRGDVKDLIEENCKKFGVEDISCPSFTAQYGFRNKFCAADIVSAVSATLEDGSDSKSYSDNFLEALDVLSRNQVDKLQSALELAKRQTEAMVDQVRSFIDMHQTVCAGPFLYAHVQEGTPNAHQFARPTIIQKLARFTLHAYSAMTKRKKTKNLPFILAVPRENDEGTCLLTGVPPIGEDFTRNFFGAAFDHAAEKTKARTNQDYFDPTVIEMKSEDRSKFFDALSALLV